MATLYLIAAALLLLLGAAGYSAAVRFGNYSQLYAEPLAKDAAGVDIWEIEKYRTEKNAFVTYEIRKQASANAVNQSHRMNAVGTNSVYTDVMGFPAVDGGFFTKDAFQLGLHEAVLNERAASTLFGGTRLSGCTFLLNNEVWTVVGVILDDDEANDNIYVPASSALITGGEASTSAGTFMVRQRGVGAAYANAAIASLKELGASESSYAFKSLGKAVAAFGEMNAAALRFALVLLLSLFAWRNGRFAFRTFRSAYADSSGSARVVVKKRADSVKAYINVLLCAACVAGALFFTQEIVELIVTWQEIPVLFNAIPPSQTEFIGRLTALGSSQATVTGLFAASLAASAAVFASSAYVFSHGS